MIGQGTHEVERKILAILETISYSKKPLGGRIISYRLKEKGIGLGERAVRYHLKMMDERGLTRSVGLRDGREITQLGREELRNALVCDKIGFLADRIELLAYLTTFDINTYTGDIPVDVSLFAIDEFTTALKAMKAILKAGLCVNDLIAVVSEGERLGEVIVPNGKMGLATVSNVVISGLLLKSGIPIDSIFAGLVQIRNFRPCRFVDVIEYQVSTIDPLEIFISCKMTRVINAVKKGEGMVLASFYEIPLLSRAATQAILEKLKTINLCSLFVMGNAAAPICEVPVNSNKIGLVLFSELNLVAAAAEKGISVINEAMGGIIDIKKLRSLQNS